MLAQTRRMEWRGHIYRFERMGSELPRSGPAIDWAVSRQGVFVGRMRSPPGESGEDFEIRSFDWLRDLLGPARVMTGAAPRPPQDL
jgi:hypothetical protein